MKNYEKMIQWVLAATVICGALVLTSCSSNDDNPVSPNLGVAEKIIGKWIYFDREGELTPTNKKRVFTFVSTTKAYVSEAYSMVTPDDNEWIDHTEATVVIDGNKVTLTIPYNEHTTGVQEFDIIAIDGSEFTTRLKVTVMVDGNVLRSSESNIRLTKVTADYHEAVLGTWQGHCTSAGSVFDDGQEHRWEYKADGTYVYYVKDGDNWVPGADSQNEYFVDGNLLCTRWVDNGQEKREWWEITIAADHMSWTVLRQNPDGATFTVTFEMERVKE